MEQRVLKCATASALEVAAVVVMVEHQHMPAETAFALASVELVAAQWDGADRLRPSLARGQIGERAQQFFAISHGDQEREWRDAQLDQGSGHGTEPRRALHGRSAGRRRKGEDLASGLDRRRPAGRQRLAERGNLVSPVGSRLQPSARLERDERPQHCSEREAGPKHQVRDRVRLDGPCQQGGQQQVARCRLTTSLRHTSRYCRQPARSGLAR